MSQRFDGLKTVFRNEPLSVDILIKMFEQNSTLFDFDSSASTSTRHPEEVYRIVLDDTFQSVDRALKALTHQGVLVRTDDKFYRFCFEDGDVNIEGRAEVRRYLDAKSFGR